jgi:hypothetical protein
MNSWQRYSPILRLSPLYCFLYSAESFSLMLSHLSVLPIISWAFGVLVRKLSPCQYFHVFLICFPVLYTVLSFMVSSLIHFGLIFIHGERYWSCFSLLHLDIQISQHHLLKSPSFLQCVLLAPLLRIRSCTCIGLFLSPLLRIVITTKGLLCFQMYFRIDFSISVKK